jgi:hypothetical protein
MGLAVSFNFSSNCLSLETGYFKIPVLHGVVSVPELGATALVLKKCNTWQMDCTYADTII